MKTSEGCQDFCPTFGLVLTSSHGLMTFHFARICKFRITLTIYFEDFPEFLHPRSTKLYISEGGLSLKYSSNRGPVNISKVTQHIHPTHSNSTCSGCPAPTDWIS